MLRVAADENFDGKVLRALLTRDRKTIVAPIKGRIQAGQPVAGVLVVLPAPIGRLIDDLYLVITAYEPEDVRDQLIYLPL